MGCVWFRGVRRAGGGVRFRFRFTVLLDNDTIHTCNMNCLRWSTYCSTNPPLILSVPSSDAEPTLSRRLPSSTTRT